MTFHKVQGSTLDKIILDFNERNFTPAVTFQMFYVST